MLRYSVVTLLVLAAMAATVASQGTQDPPGTVDGPCPVIPRNHDRPLQYYRLEGKWNEYLRFNDLQPNQCPTSNTYEGRPPNMTVTISSVNPDGTENPAEVREAVVQEDTYKRLFENDNPGPAFPDPSGMIFETIYTNYRNIHVFWICSELEGNKHVPYVWIETREGKQPSQRKINTQIRRLQELGIDTSRFWEVGPEFCTE